VRKRVKYFSSRPRQAMGAVAVFIILTAGLTFRILSYQFYQQDVIIVDCTHKLAFWCRAANDPAYFSRGGRVGYLLHALRSGWSLGAPDSGGFLITEVVGILNLEDALLKEQKEMDERKANNVNINWSIGLRWEDYGCAFFVNPQFKGEVIRIQKGTVSPRIITMIAEMTRMKPDTVGMLAHPCTVVLHSEEWDEGEGKPIDHLVINNGCIFYQTFMDYNSY